MADEELTNKIVDELRVALCNYLFIKDKPAGAEFYVIYGQGSSYSKYDVYSLGQMRKIFGADDWWKEFFVPVGIEYGGIYKLPRDNLFPLFKSLMRELCEKGK